MKRLALTLALVAAAVVMPACSDEADKPDQERQHEVLQHRTSGFWTSNRPAEHGRYKWRLLALGAVLATVTGIVLYRVLRRATTERFAGAGAPAVSPPPRAAEKPSHDPPDVPSAVP